MGKAIAKFALSIFKIGWLPLVLWIFELRSYLPNRIQSWLSQNFGFVFWTSILLTVIWVILMAIAEWPNIRDAYHRFRPEVKFNITNHSEAGNYTVSEDNKTIVTGVNLYFEGYFENEGGLPSTVKRIETQLYRKKGILNYPVGKRMIKAAYFVEGERELLDNHRGFYIGEYSISKIIHADSHCLFDNKINIDKINENYTIKIRWHVLGQELKDTEIHPDWNIFRKKVAYFLESHQFETNSRSAEGSLGEQSV